jgi:hypothetical protein
MPLNNNFPFIIITWFISDDDNGDDDDDNADDRHSLSYTIPTFLNVIKLGSLYI